MPNSIDPVSMDMTSDLKAIPGGFVLTGALDVEKMINFTCNNTPTSLFLEKKLMYQVMVMQVCPTPPPVPSGGECECCVKAFEDYLSALIPKLVASGATIDVNTTQPVGAGNINNVTPVKVADGYLQVTAPGTDKVNDIPICHIVTVSGTDVAFTTTSPDQPQTGIPGCCCEETTRALLSTPPFSPFTLDTESAGNDATITDAVLVSGLTYNPGEGVVVVQGTNGQGKKQYTAVSLCHITNVRQP